MRLSTACSPHGVGMCCLCGTSVELSHVVFCWHTCSQEIEITCGRRRIMFDEVGEAALHNTDLAARLSAALDGPAAWMAAEVPRAVARNLLAKLGNPPLRPPLGHGLQRLRNEAALYWRAFPSLPEHARSQRSTVWDGNRLDDPMVRRTCLASRA